VHVRNPLLLTTGLALAVVASAGTATADAPKVVKLSNETTLSRTANPNFKSKIKASPNKGSRTVGRLRLSTEDGLPEVYLVLRQATHDDGSIWYQVRIPTRPNGRTGWVDEGSLGPLHTLTTQLVVSRRTLRATLYRKGRKIFRAPVGVGKRGTETPGGRFWIRERLVLRGGHGAYGPIAFGTGAYSTKLTDWPKGGVVGIHGTNEPGLVPGRPSHGCIRMHNKDILRLARLMPVGTPLRIL
jgi:lipoprotein-anchoring transpeptidase ErfK/SrfK